MESDKLGVYIHIPFCKSKCSYCAFVSTPDFSFQKKYVVTLIDEIKNSDSKGRVCDTVYIGGGTPSCLYDGALTEIFNAVQDAFVIDRFAEITVECNPESVGKRFISECKNSGVNRISMGLQSSNDAVLKNIGRLYDFNGFMSAILLLSKSFDNISTDLILGLPGQSIDDIDRSVDIISDFCSHVSVYALSVEEGTPLYKTGFSVNDDLIADMYERTVKLLHDSGYARYEVSNFARNDKQSKHNLKYWRNMPYLGFGVAAHGYNGSDTRYEHWNDISHYIEDPTPNFYKLTEKDRYNEYIMLALRTERGISLDDFRKTFGYSITDNFASVIDKYIKCGYMILSEKFLRIAPQYMFVMNGIIEELMKD